MTQAESNQQVAALAVKRTMYLRNHYQNAYVTRDLDRAISLIETRYGLKGLFPIDVTQDVVTPSGKAKLNMRLAYAWIGKLQIELIQPVSGCVDHYVDSLPPSESDHSPRFNHVALRRDTWKELKLEVEALKLPVLVEGSLQALRFIYVDARQDLGHLLEYVWATPEMWQRLGWPA